MDRGLEAIVRALAECDPASTDAEYGECSLCRGYAGHAHTEIAGVWHERDCPWLLAYLWVRDHG